ncbi:STAS domain-containing protein [Stenotrophomonas sp. BIGb0135]|uniref:STAS domain-containing protein n=1 Tax=Stenotrophomonas nematodicola TaxID=2656746 RepID=A0ABW7D2P3_9GAMM|nr:STAS domain-containing protein [Stenotrophomonas sp. BIGb0135]MCS4235866.1 phospholipid transport system transporter-binding protein [Stenotrophomonas sp. BIGb0135]
MASNPASVSRQDTALVFSGVLDRAAVTALWPALQASSGVQVLDLTAVPRVDSAGLALLAELAARLRAQGSDPRFNGAPAGFNELGAAYRLAPSLDFNASTAAS